MSVSSVCNLSISKFIASSTLGLGQLVQRGRQVGQREGAPVVKLSSQENPDVDSHHAALFFRRFPATVVVVVSAPVEVVVTVFVVAVFVVPVFVVAVLVVPVSVAPSPAAVVVVVEGTVVVVTVVVVVVVTVVVVVVVVVVVGAVHSGHLNSSTLPCPVLNIAVGSAHM